MSKYDRYKKSSEDYIYPHKHCKKCGEMIEEAFTYCPDCYKKMKFSLFKRKNKQTNDT
jgi:predicted nucleic acid-binding Zn ribbon protein